MANHTFEKEGVAMQLKIIADDVMYASLAIDGKDPTKMDAILRRMIKAYEGLLALHALIFDEVPPWAPENERKILQQMLDEKRRNTN